MKRILSFCVCLVLIFVIAFPSTASADPMTVSQLASLGYALGSSFGLDFTMEGITSSGANEYFSSKINNYLAGRSITEVFGDEAARIVAGKLVVPHLLYNGLKEFLKGFAKEEGLSTENKNMIVQSGNYRCESLGLYRISKTGSDYTSVPRWSIYNISTGKTTYKTGGSRWEFRERLTNEGIIIKNNYFYGLYSYYQTTGTTYDDVNFNVLAGQSYQSIGASLSQPIDDIVLNPDKEWSGTIGGEDWPDTNLDELLGNIDQEVIDGTLDVDGEIVDPVVPPTPVPTPIPIDPDTPLQDVPWEGLNDLIGQTEQGINQQIQSQTQSVTSAQEATTEAVESLTETISGALDVPQSEELPDFKFDLRELFPFCIPFDIYRLLSSFDAEPQAPHVQLPIVIESIGFSYNLDLDFSAWDPVAQAMRTAELIVYAIALAWATGKVIKW